MDHQSPAATSKAPGNGDHQHHGDGHHGGLGKYLAVFAALCGLTLVSFFIANSTIKETAPMTAWAAMMAVSAAKALLVMLFFMHLIWEANWKYVLTIPAGMMSLFLVVMLVPDVGQRAWYYHPTRWLYATEFAEHAADPAHDGASHADGAGEHDEHGNPTDDTTADKKSSVPHPADH